MSPFPNWPNPERFRTLQDALAFLERPDWRLCIPVFVTTSTPEGKVSMVNPEYRDAPYEQSIIRSPIRVLTRQKKAASSAPTSSE